MLWMTLESSKQEAPERGTETGACCSFIPFNPQKRRGEWNHETLQIATRSSTVDHVSSLALEFLDSWGHRFNWGSTSSTAKPKRRGKSPTRAACVGARIWCHQQYQHPQIWNSKPSPVSPHISTSLHYRSEVEKCRTSSNQMCLAVFGPYSRDHVWHPTAGAR